jgi:hypothetical protein
LNLERQQFIDKKMGSFKFKFLNDFISSCRDSEEAVYATCSLTQDFMQMLFKAVNSKVPQQEAKAAFKIALDSVLLDYGMSVAIHEFKQ